jgi:serine/threonine-protein phosphatase 2A regulatory subunit B''
MYEGVLKGRGEGGAQRLCFDSSVMCMCAKDNFALTTRIVERIMAGIPRRLLSAVSGKMCYEDFVIFLISEVDKTSEVSHEYWFRAVDLDGDGIISQYEMEYFFQEQSSRMQGLSQEIVRFEDILCQL